MATLDDRVPTGRALPPITAAARRAEQVAAAVALAARLGRVPGPHGPPPAPVPPRRLPPTAVPMPTGVALSRGPTALVERRRRPIPVDVLAALAVRPAVPSDFREAPTPDGAPPAPLPPTVAAIVRAVCAHYGVSRVDLSSARRDRAVARPRQLAMWLAATLSTASLPEIGRRLGNRDHTTVMHGRDATVARLAADPGLRVDVDALVAQLTRGT